jgi:hypothetical protein
MTKRAALNDVKDNQLVSSAELTRGCQKLQDQARGLFEQKFSVAGARLNCSIKTLTGHELHLEPAQINSLVAVTSFALGALVAKQEKIAGALERLGGLKDGSPLPRLTLVNETRELSSGHLQKFATSSALKSENRLESVETTHPYGQSTIENWRGQKWLHQEGYARVPMHKEGASWWHDPSENLTWVKTSQYLESRSNDGSFFRTYKNGGIQIRFGNGHEFYESSFPERRKIVLAPGKLDCRTRLQGILSAEDSDFKTR